MCSHRNHIRKCWLSLVCLLISFPVFSGGHFYYVYEGKTPESTLATMKLDEKGNSRLSVSTRSYQDISRWYKKSVLDTFPLLRVMVDMHAELLSGGEYDFSTIKLEKTEEEGVFKAEVRNVPGFPESIHIERGFGAWFMFDNKFFRKFKSGLVNSNDTLAGFGQGSTQVGGVEYQYVDPYYAMVKDARNSGKVETKWLPDPNTSGYRWEVKGGSASWVWHNDLKEFCFLSDNPSIVLVFKKCDSSTHEARLKEIYQAAKPKEKKPVNREQKEDSEASLSQQLKNLYTTYETTDENGVKVIKKADAKPADLSKAAGLYNSVLAERKKENEKLVREGKNPKPATPTAAHWLVGESRK